MIVTAENYPRVFKALQTVDIANGAVNRHEPAKTEYDIPPYWFGTLDECEAGLATLTSEELETFCDGEDSEAAELIGSRPCIKVADNLLNAYFDGFVD